VALQGNMSQNARQRAMDGFRARRFDVLVATDIAARGIDVEQVSHVVNFDMPTTADGYTHRIGRTGRLSDRRGVTFFSEGDDAMLRDIEKVLGSKIERRKLDDFAYGSFPAPKTFESNGRSGQDGRGGQDGRSQNGQRSQNGRTQNGGYQGQRSQNGHSNSNAPRSTNGHTSTNGYGAQNGRGAQPAGSKPASSYRSSYNQKDRAD
jgi:superfamily II DNA/RNA helicase